jgi:hypothetical protein
MLLCCFLMQVFGGANSSCLSLVLAFFLWSAVEARRGEISAPCVAALEVVGQALMLRLLRAPSRRQLFGFYAKPIFFAHLLLPVAGVVSLRVGHFASLVLAKNPLLQAAPDSSGVGSDFLEHHLGGG